MSPVPVTITCRATVCADGRSSLTPLPQPVKVPNAPARSSTRRRVAERGSRLRALPMRAAASSPGIQRMDAGTAGALLGVDGFWFRSAEITVVPDVFTVIVDCIGAVESTVTVAGWKVQVVPTGGLEHAICRVPEYPPTGVRVRTTVLEVGTPLETVRDGVLSARLTPLAVTVQETAAEVEGAKLFVLEY
jgi:hypothetical protein